MYCYCCGTNMTTVNPDGYNQWYYNRDHDENVLCKNCYNRLICAPKSREKNRDKRNKTCREKYATNPEPALRASKKWQLKNKQHMTEYKKDYQLKHRERERARNRRYQSERRIRVLMMVGKGKIICSQCGCDFSQIIQIHHLNGGGTQEMRKGWKIPKHFYKAILNGTRKIDDLALLCPLCNVLEYLTRKYGELQFSLTWNKK